MEDGTGTPAVGSWAGALLLLDRGSAMGSGVMTVSQERIETSSDRETIRLARGETSQGVSG
jgi:hypothetical protein